MSISEQAPSTKPSETVSPLRSTHIARGGGATCHDLGGCVSSFKCYQLDVLSFVNVSTLVTFVIFVPKCPSIGLPPDLTSGEKRVLLRTVLH